MDLPGSEPAVPASWPAVLIFNSSAVASLREDADSWSGLLANLCRYPLRLQTSTFYSEDPSPEKYPTQRQRTDLGDQADLIDQLNPW